MACVPLGVSRFNVEAAMRPHTPSRGRPRWSTWWRAGSSTFLSALGRRLVYAADEYYLLAGRPFPRWTTYGAIAQHDNGVGMAPRLRSPLPRPPRGARRRAGRLLPVGRRRPGQRLPGAPRAGTGHPATPAGRARHRADRHLRRPGAQAAGGRRSGGRGAGRRQRLLRRQHRRGRPADRRRPDRWPWPTTRRTVATCCPTCASRAGGSSTACRRATCPGRSRSSGRRRGAAGRAHR